MCGVDPAAGFASIGDDFYCHGDDDVSPTCYERSQHLLLPAPRADSKDPLASVERLLDEWLNETERWVGFGLSNPSREAVRLLIAVARDIPESGLTDNQLSLLAFAGSLDDH